jgi:DNA-binding transcriptional LysR family regulator
MGGATEVRAVIENYLLQHFISVAQTRSFVQAALEAYASPSVISRSIKKLEEAMGVTLFERTTRSVTLTPAGTAFLVEATAILDRLAVATENARRIAHGETARLRIGVCTTAEPEVGRIARGLYAFRARWPNVRVALQTIMFHEQADALRTAKIDVGIMRLSRVDSEGLEWGVISRQSLAVTVPTRWNLPSRSVRLEDLRARPWIMPDPEISPEMYRFQMEVCRGAGFEPQVACLARDTFCGRLMLESGMGAALLFRQPSVQPGSLSQIMMLEGVSEHFRSDTVVAWASGSNSQHIKDLAADIAREVNH